MVVFMEINAINSFDKSVKFEGTKKVESKAVENPIVEHSENNPKSKALMYSLGALAAVAAAGVLINNLKHGKVKAPEIKLPDPPTPPLTPNPPVVPKPPVVEDITEVASKLTEEAQKIKEGVSEALHKKEPLNPKLGETIDERLGRKGMDVATREDMQKYYTEMAEKAESEAKLLAEKQAKRDAMLKLKEENPEEYARLKAERAKAQKLEKQQRKAAQLAKNTEIIEVNGTKIKRIEEVTANGKVIRDYSVDGNNLIREVRVKKNGEYISTTHTIYGENSKVTFSSVRSEKFYEPDVIVQKKFIKNEKGKYELVSRESIQPNGSVEKQVVRLDNGNTEIEVTDPWGNKKNIIRDKKGNIVSQKDISNPKAPKDPSQEPPKLLETWYKNYLKLCKEYGVSPRACGKGGAWDHFYELSLRKNDPKAYDSYIRIRAKRTSLSEKAKLLELLEKLDFGNIEDISKKDLEILKRYIQDANLEGQELTKFQEFIRTIEQQLAQRTQQVQTQGPQVVYA